MDQGNKDMTPEAGIDQHKVVQKQNDKERNEVGLISC